MTWYPTSYPKPGVTLDWSKLTNEQGVHKLHQLIPHPALPSLWAHLTSSAFSDLFLVMCHGEALGYLLCNSVACSLSHSLSCFIDSPCDICFSWLQLVSDELLQKRMFFLICNSNLFFLIDCQPTSFIFHLVMSSGIVQKKCMMK